MRGWTRQLVPSGVTTPRRRGRAPPGRAEVARRGGWPRTRWGRPTRGSKGGEAAGGGGPHWIQPPAVSRSAPADRRGIRARASDRLAQTPRRPSGSACGVRRPGPNPPDYARRPGLLAPCPHSAATAPVRRGRRIPCPRRWRTAGPGATNLQGGGVGLDRGLNFLQVIQVLPEQGFRRRQVRILSAAQRLGRVAVPVVAGRVRGRGCASDDEAGGHRGRGRGLGDDGTGWDWVHSRSSGQGTASAVSHSFDLRRIGGYKVESQTSDCLKCRHLGYPNPRQS